MFDYIFKRCFGVEKLFFYFLKFLIIGKCYFVNVSGFNIFLEYF